jgi:hypothetical protein
MDLKISEIRLPKLPNNALKNVLKQKNTFDGPMMYIIIAFISVIVFLCIFGRTILKGYCYTPEVTIVTKPQESEDAQMQRIINEWKGRLNKSRIQKRSKYYSYADVPYESIDNKELKITLDKYARTYQVETSLILALMKIESGFNPRVTSHAGARGLMQLMPGTARLMGLAVNHEVDERLDPAKNIMAGTRYLRLMLNTFDNPVEAIAAYNIGPEVIRKGTPSNTETLQHVYKVIRLKYEYEQNSILMQRDMATMLQRCKNQSLVMDNELSRS